MSTQSAGSSVALAPFTLVITHAQLSSGPSGADAVGISGSRITAIGRSADLQAQCRGSCRVLDARGGYLMPGFHDAHGHQDLAARLKDGVQVSGESVPVVQREVSAYAQAHLNEPWILGGVWFMRSFGKNLPAKTDLDKVEATRPVALRDSTLHNFWVNSKALQLAGITRYTPDPPGGRIGRLPDGEPSGILLETATAPVRNAMPLLSLAKIRYYILEGERMSLTTGHTSVQGGPVGPITIGVYGDLDHRGELTQRAFLWGDLSATDTKFQEAVAAANALPSTGKVKVVGFKGFIDGVLSGRTAAVLAPYADEPGNHGLIKMPQAQLDSLVLRANRANFAVALHAVGDQAVRMALDSFENAKNALGSTPMNRVEHVSMIHPADVPRFGSLGAVASVQPTLMYYPSRAEFSPDEALGRPRAEQLFRWKDLLDGGAPLVFGTDFPVGTLPAPDPVTVLYCAVQRKFKDGTDYTPRQRLPFDVARAAYTETPARVIGLGNVIGKLEPGYEADLVILTANPTGKQSVVDDPVVAVVVAGRVVS